MKKFKEFYLVKLILKLALVSAFVIGFVFLIYLFINSEGEHKISVWQKIKDVPRVNFFKFFG